LLLARAFAAEGCKIAICSRDAEELAGAKHDLEERGATVATVVCDISDRDQVNAMVGEVTGRFRQIDILVNNAGVIQVGPMSSMTLGDYEEAMDIMFWGVLYPTLAVLPQMRERGAGRIVNITSIGGKVSAPHLLPYNCAKFAAVGLSEGLRAELARDGIAVTTIVPGLMRTGSHENASFKGKGKAEYAWFSLGATLPFISMDAERAASQIVEAAKKGSAERILSLPATVAARVHGVFPGLTSDLLSMVNRILPRDESDSTGRTQGRQAQEAIHSAVLDALTTFGRSAARRFNQRRYRNE
jgi:short-subunit dehydrogenase